MSNEKGIIVVNCLGELLSEHTTMQEAWATEPTSACYIINWHTGEVFSPVVEDNTFYGEFEHASPTLTGTLLEQHKEHNPLEFDYKKIRRRVEDALRKTDNNAILLEMARRLKAKIR